MRRVPLFAATLCGTLAHAQSDTPLSAIDWLSRSVATPVAAPAAPQLDEDATALSGTAPTVTTTSLDAPSIDRIGLMQSDISGLPSDLWSASTTDDLLPLIARAEIETLPALQSLLTSLLLTASDGPGGSAPAGTLFVARVDKLLDMGALDPALALLEEAGPTSPDLYRRWFDVSLLTGTEDRACAAQAAIPGLETTIPARIFCLARDGDWPAAALTLNTARVLGEIDPNQEALLSRFLDTELFEGEAPLPAPPRPSPLVFRMREAIGEGLPTATLPRAFAHADLRNTVAWRYQMEAAERLLRSGAIADNVLLGLYTARRPAASGGVWDRARDVQAFDTAIASGDLDAVEATLPAAWDVMRDIRAEVPFARLYAETLPAALSSGASAQIATDMRLLTGLPIDVQTTRRSQLLRAIATDTRPDMTATTRMERAVLTGLGEIDAPYEIIGLIRSGKHAEAILESMAQFEGGRMGNASGIRDGLAGLRAVGLDDIARQTAIEFLMLERPQ